MFERAERSTRAIILHPVFPGEGPESQDEFCELARSAGAEIVAVITAPRNQVDARFFVGSGKVDEVADQAEAVDAGLILVSKPLSAVQERNIEKRCARRVLDRTGLILDIFAQRAQSHEGKLEVELAQLRHLSTRLVRGWTHLERQKGGIGLRGPGETQLETDRRLLGVRISQLRARLDKVQRQRTQSRRRRSRSDVSTVALVGYTNAGKSTLFNQLTDAEVDTRDMQFATLDPTVRKLRHASGERILVADTVGFVSDLPPELIAAFRATLLEAREADFLLHVIDISDPFHMERRSEVEQVLSSIGAGDIPCLRVNNKADKTDHSAGQDIDARGHSFGIYVSALTGAGVDELRELLVARMEGDRVILHLNLGPADAAVRARLFELNAVLDEHAADTGGWQMSVRLSERDLTRLARQDDGLGEFWANCLEKAAEDVDREDAA